MVLETLDNDHNDIFIYSENKFDLDNNFKLIKKNNITKKPHSIHYNDVCVYLADNQPKNTILYRLLTSNPGFDLEYIKYGYFVKINGETEVIYFDPIFAVKEIQEFSANSNGDEVRFRIQQVGLSSVAGEGDYPNFNEVYCFDLEANEVQWQNDRVFAEIIFAFDNIEFEHSESSAVTVPPTIAATKKEAKVEPVKPRKLEEIRPERAKARFVTLSGEDLDFNKSPKKSSESAGNSSDVKEEQIPETKPATGMFEEDNRFDPNEAKKIVVLNKRIGNKTEQTVQKKVEEKISFVDERGDNPFFFKAKEPAAKRSPASAFTSFLKRKRSDVVTQRDTVVPATNETKPEVKVGELTESLKNFMSEKDKRAVVLRFKR